MKKIRPFLIIPLFCLLLACGTDFTSSTSIIAPVSDENTEEIEKKKSDEREEDSFTEEEDNEVLFEEYPPEREWTIMLYMAADNNLEGDAITDFNELENADFDESVCVLLLFDRAENYDATNGDWSDTRLYRLCHDDQKNKALIVSERLDCPELGISKTSGTELDMANPLTLSSFLEFSRRAYPANNYALMVWGHGTGWRNECDADFCEPFSADEGFRAFALDDASSSYMTISQLGNAVREGMGEEALSVIGFDTCFAVCLESAFEFSDCAAFMLGTPALVPDSGWNYTAFLNQLMSSQKKVEDFISAACDNYSELYKNYAYAAFSCIDLSKIPAIVQEFSEYAGQLASKITDKTIKDQVFELFSDKAVSYCSTTYPTDYYVDFSDILSYLDGFHPSGKLKDLLSIAQVFSWSATGEEASLALFFCVYRSAGVISGSHPSMYVNGSRETNLSRFVTECDGYVPTADRRGSLLDKLFYANYQYE